jgi:hypothetical protein
MSCVERKRGKAPRSAVAADTPGAEISSPPTARESISTSAAETRRRDHLQYQLGNVAFDICCEESQPAKLSSLGLCCTMPCCPEQIALADFRVESRIIIRPCQVEERRSRRLFRTRWSTHYSEPAIGSTRQLAGSYSQAGKATYRESRH